MNSFSSILRSELGLRSRKKISAISTFGCPITRTQSWTKKKVISISHRTSFRLYQNQEAYSDRSWNVLHISAYSNYGSKRDRIVQKARARIYLFFSDEKMDRYLAICILGLGLIMLIAPLWILAFLGELVPRLAVISAFVLLFVVLLSFTTVAKPFESLAAAAA